MRSEESIEFTTMRRDQEDAEAFLASKDRPKYVRPYWRDPARIEEKDPRERD